MSVLVYTESWNGIFRKSSFETVSYASETAKVLGTEVVAVSIQNVSDERSEERRVGKECRSRWSPYH